MDHAVHTCRLKSGRYLRRKKESHLLIHQSFIQIHNLVVVINIIIDVEAAQHMNIISPQKIWTHSVSQ